MSTTAPASSASSAAAPLEPRAIRRLANAIRALAMDAVQKANSGHPGMPMGMADVATVLFSQFLNFDPKDPAWPDRDRFVLSAGHGSMLLYAVLYLTGYARPSIEDIKNFRQFGSPCAGHPEYGHLPGVETTTGPLGQGIATAVGMALAERMLNARYGDDLVSHRTYVFAGDGDLMEGVSHEACSLAGHLRLNRLIVLYDDNHISIDGATSLADSTNTLERFDAMGWKTMSCDGMNGAEVAAALDAAQNSDRPVLIACRTTIGYGLPTRAGTAKAHGEAPGTSEIEGARKNLDWPYPAFTVPEDVLNEWRRLGTRGAKLRAAWNQRLAGSARRADFEDALKAQIGPEVIAAIAAHKQKLVAEKPKIATRKASEGVLEVINAASELTLGGSADLTGSNNTLTKGLVSISPQNYGGRYIHYGIREHGMAAAMNGIALHGGFIPYGGTFLVFSDYARPSIRLAALMQSHVVYVMTHDSIGLGEDGPTHQPVEHLASLRAIPGLTVFRPADAVEVAECWELALTRKAPALLSLTRQNLATLRQAPAHENLCALGGYEIAAADGTARVTLMASGSEVEIAVSAQGLLKEKGIPARVVSVPSFELFAAQDEDYRARVLGNVPRVAVEAAVRMSWDRYLGPKDRFIGLDHFGASAPYLELYRQFGITPQSVAAAAEEACQKAR
ncbi:MAG: transketolase [Alphaproteobacteria bacterium]|nr:transketolase [Alphaproteobacteria bacterium]